MDDFEKELIRFLLYGIGLAIEAFIPKMILNINLQIEIFDIKTARWASKKIGHQPFNSWKRIFWSRASALAWKEWGRSSEYASYLMERYHEKYGKRIAKWNDQLNDICGGIL